MKKNIMVNEEMEALVELEGKAIVLERLLEYAALLFISDSVPIKVIGSVLLFFYALINIGCAGMELD